MTSNNDGLAVDSWDEVLGGSKSDNEWWVEDSQDKEGDEVTYSNEGLAVDSWDKVLGGAKSDNEVWVENSWRAVGNLSQTETFLQASVTHVFKDRDFKIKIKILRKS